MVEYPDVIPAEVDFRSPHQMFEPTNVSAASELKEITLEIGGVFRPADFMSLTVKATETRIPAKGMTEDQFYAEALERLTQNFDKLFAKTALDYKEKQKSL